MKFSINSKDLTERLSDRALPDYCHQSVITNSKNWGFRQ